MGNDMPNEINEETVKLVTLAADELEGISEQILSPASGKKRFADYAAAIRQLLSRHAEACEWMPELDKLLQDLFARLAGLIGCQQTDQELCLRVAHMLSKVQRDRKLLESKLSEGKNEGEST